MKQSLPRTSPAAQGVSSAGILGFLDGVAESPGELHSFILVRRGNIVAEGYWGPYTAERQHLLYSLSKSFTSTAAGFAVQEGFLSLDDPVLKFFPDDAPAEISPNLAAMQVRHLLMMGTGHETEPALWQCPDDNWAKWFLAAPVTKAPGDALPLQYRRHLHGLRDCEKSDGERHGGISDTALVRPSGNCRTGN